MFWDPPREAFTIPYLDIAVYWYSIFFACGFFVSFFLVRHFLRPFFTRHSKELTPFVDRLAWYIFIGTLVGARLGHVLFYEPSYYFENPVEIVMIRHGGLSSHGAAAGILISLWLFWRRHGKKQKSLSSPLQILDVLAIAAAFAGVCIRIGNFFNQEIQGTPTHLPWAITFGHPADGALGPCHPVVLYEAVGYLVVFVILLWQARNGALAHMKAGRLFGLFCLLVFSFRFLIEFVKLPQETVQLPLLSMGQVLSLPFIALGWYFFKRQKR